MSGDKRKSTNLDRRQFVKGAVASTAAMGIIPIGQACAITRDANGQIVDWVCRIAVVGVLPEGTIYRFRNCRTGAEWNGVDEDNMDLGNCGSPTSGGCYDRYEFENFERVEIKGEEFVLLPNLDASQRAAVMKELPDYVDQLRSS